MEKEFVPYQQALELKELGFDKPCFGLWNLNNGKYEVDIIGVCQYSKEFKYREVLAPLYQQAFRWFREKYNLREQYGVFPHHTIMMNYLIEGGREEEAELACLIKLISIVKEKL